MRRRIVILIVLLLSMQLHAQYNTNRVLISGQIALDNHDYVVAIQHFNNILALRPYLYEPWYYRGIAKLCLDDYVGAESDLDEAIKLNPYIHQMYAARAECRINRKNYDAAIADLDKAISISPDEKGYWYNRAFCRYFKKDYEQTHKDLEYVVAHWPKMTNAYSLQTEVFLTEKDTVQATRWLERTLEVNPYDGNSWSIMGRMHMQRKEWKEAEENLSNAIHYQPRVVNNYMYRAMCRVNMNKLRQGMEDYDKAIDMDPNNFLSHYNRGLLRQMVGDDNRAIEDFNFVLKYEPENLLALYNRAILLDRTGSYREAIRDYSRVIEKFPNFWSGLMSRAQCYRRLGMTAKAQADENRVMNAQLDKHFGGVQKRWSKGKLREVRKMSDVDVEKYDQWVVVDDDVVTPQYKNEYRGNVQDRTVGNDLMPMFALSYMPYRGGVNTYQMIDKELEDFNNLHKPLRNIAIACKTKALDESGAKQFFQLIDTLGAAIAQSHDVKTAADLLLQRAVGYYTTHNIEAAVTDLDDYLTIDSTSTLAYWQRGVCQSMLNEFEAAQSGEARLRSARIQDDFQQALRLSPDNIYIIYNIGTFHALQKDYPQAITYLEKAVEIHPRLAEAHYNLGLVLMLSGEKEKGLKELSKAGELGIYDAYSVMKRYAAEK